MRILLRAGCAALLLCAGTLPAQIPKELPRSRVVESISIDAAPFAPFLSMGDLWFTTWADDDKLYGAWSDGTGPVPLTTWSLMTDCGILEYTGDPPKLTATVVRRDAPTQFEPRVDDKPSSLLAVDGRLYGAFHSPLGDARIGYLAYSDDDGSNWSRLGFFLPGETKPANASPWTNEANSNFRCLFLINMGKNYSLNSDGYVYGLGIGKEWDWDGPVYLARVQRVRIVSYSAWEYFSGLDASGKPHWSKAQSDAKPVPGLYTPDQGSAIYHAGVKRYLFLNKEHLWEAPQPWGPWTVAGDFPSEPEAWQKGYQPGIITKGAGPDSFWFTIAGKGTTPNLSYSLHIGKMVMRLAPGSQ